MKEKDISTNEPTRSELEILQVLWKHGPATVRFVNDTLNEMKRAVQYTSTLKQMQVMVEKSLLTRDESSMKHIYHPAIEEKKTKGAMLDKMVESMFDGSASNMVMQLLGNKKTPEKDLQAIKEILAKLDKEKK